jgi:Helicase conserved C-terminal domain
MYLSSHNDYRPDMMNVSNFVQSYGVQTLLLTATLPERCQSELLEKLNLDKVPITVLRDSTTRKNIRYEVCHIGNQSLLLPVQSILNEPRFQNERIIIYVQYIKDGDKLSNELQLPFYHAKMPEKNSMLHHWITSTMNRVIIATSAMGCGIDIPDVRLVLHAGSPKSMVDFAQQSGRAGRDGNVSYSLTLHRKFDIKNMEYEMQQYISGHGKCRRIILDFAMDGNVREKCSSIECPCDCCCKQLSETTFALASEMASDSAKFDDSHSISPTTVMEVTPLFPVDNIGNDGSVYNLDIDDGIDDGIDDYNSDNGGIELEDVEEVDPGIVNMDGSFAAPQVGLGIFTPHAQLPVPMITYPSNSCDNEGLENQRKRLFIEQGLMEEQRKRSNYLEVQQEESFDVQSLERWLSAIPSFVDGCFVCRILNQTGPCTNRKEHNKKRYEIEKERKLVGDKVNKCGQSYAGVPIPAYCSCTMPGCYVPQMFCTTWESNGNGGYRRAGQNCNHRDKLLDVVIALRDSNEGAREYVLEQCDGDDLTKLLTTKIVRGREKMLLLHQVFIDMCKKYLG